MNAGRKKIVAEVRPSIKLKLKSLVAGMMDTGLCLSVLLVVCCMLIKLVILINQNFFGFSFEIEIRKII